MCLTVLRVLSDKTLRFFHIKIHKIIDVLNYFINYYI